ncbi:hypothetical protein EI555_020607 [Monodon monoceros]|uniref:Type I cytokine receptor cytokine-binding domain-containing protein n=1 Tax=Monodon monoceros TaxID=40151 RepID=A0A4U1F5X7_MONMO|nr:hypothetical protein EI555_020607 [Monodon monoceros]
MMLFTYVNPPQDFEIVDPGYLGYLYLQWQPPLSLDNFKECTVEYELKYRNIGSASWKSCIYDEVYLQLFGIFNGKDIGKHSSYNTSFYRYEGLDHVLQCADYIKANGKNIGCMFPYLESSDCKDFYICVNGSSESQVIRPSYFIFQLQNIVKPLPPDYLSLTVKNSEEINLKWSIPKGPIPAKCFIYEIEFTEDDTAWVIFHTKKEASSNQFRDQKAQASEISKKPFKAYANFRLIDS